MKIKAIFLLALLCMVVQGAWADGVNYIECSWSGGNTTGHVVKTTKTYTGSYTTYNSNNEDADTFNDGWYVLSGSFTFKKRICIDGDVKIILADGCTATFKMGICIKPGKTLTIYAQSDGDNKGYLNAEMNDFEGFENESIGDDLAAIGGNPDEVGGSLVIHGGHIYAKPVENNAAGIGGSEGSDSNGKSTGMESVTIYDGTIEAKGKSSGAGIGCGEKNSNPPTVTIYGGNITAKGGKYAAGIGGSEDCSNGTIKIYGGTVNATGGEEGTGIGSGDTNMSNPIYIYGGTVTATGGKNGAGIGSGFRGDMSANIYIYRGTITATGGNGGAGIGSGRRGSQTSTIYIYGGTVTAKGGEYGGAGIGSGLGDSDDLVSAGRIKIYDGEVYATGGAGNAGTSGGAGIGGGGCGNGGTLTVYSGYVEAKSNGAEAAAIGGGSSGKGGNSYFYGGTVKAILTNEAQHGSNNKNFAYIGRGGSSSDLDMGHVYFGTDMMVSTDGTKASASDRESACQTQPGAIATTLTITTCEHSFTYSEYDYQHHFRSTCPYCNISSDYDFHTYGSDGHTCTLCGFNASDPKTLTFYEANAGGKGYEVTTTETHDRLTERKLPSYTNVPSRLAFEGWVKVDNAPGINEAVTVVTDEQAASMTIYKAGQTYTVEADAIFKAVYKNGWDGEGSGTEADPYIISTIADFNQLASITASCYYYDGKYFRMDADLDFTGESFTPVGNSTKPFKGILDGEGHSISGIYVETADTYKALFGIVHGTVKNLTLTNSTFKANTNVGGIVCENWGTIENCHVTSSVSIEYYSGNGGNFGGIVGSNNGTVDGCTSAATVDGKNIGKVGGIVGYNEGTLKNSLYYGNNVTDGEYVGAIVGWEHTSYGTLTSNYYVPWTDGPAAVVNMGSSSSQDVSGAKAGYTVTSGTDGLTLDFGTASSTYENNGIEVFNFGLSYDGTLYSGSGQSVTFTPESDEEILNVAASGGSLTDNGDGTYTLTMPAANVTITATLGNYDITLYDGSHDPTNAETITANDDYIANVTISGRTLYKDGDWNTLCLPFDIDDISTSPLAGATIMELDVDGIYDTDKQTGFDADGTLYLYFREVDEINAGMPYLVKWTSGSNIVSPTFSNVEIDDDLESVESEDGKVQFIGIYDPAMIYSAANDNLYLGAENTLYWPSEVYTLNAFRAYFHVELGGDQHVREIRLNLDGGEATGVELVHGSRFLDEPSGKAERKVQGAGAWFDLFGRKLNSKPTVPGIYMNNGKKIAITK